MTQEEQLIAQEFHDLRSRIGELTVELNNTKRALDNSQRAVQILNAAIERGRVAVSEHDLEIIRRGEQVIRDYWQQSDCSVSAAEVILLRYLEEFKQELAVGAVGVKQI